MSLEQHLAHLLWLISPPFFQNFKEHAWTRAQELARSNPELSELPMRLKESVKRLESNNSPEKALTKD